MQKILKIFTGICSLALVLHSCRNEDMAMEEQKQKKQIQEFAAFAQSKSLTAKETGRDMTYQKGFADLYKKYHDLHGGYALGNIPVQSAQTAQAGKTAMSAESGNAEYIDFRYASPVIDYKNGSKIVLYPLVKNGRVTDLIAGYVNTENTVVDYYYVEHNAFIDSYIAEYQRIMYGGNKAAFSFGTSSTDPANPTDIGDIQLVAKKREEDINVCKDCICYEDCDMGGGGMPIGSGGGGGGAGGNPTDRPCVHTKANNDAAKNILNNVSAAVNAAVTAQDIASNDSYEYGFLVDANGNATPNHTSYNTGALDWSSYVNAPNFCNSNYVLLFHTHPGTDGYNAPSPGDLKALVKVFAMCKDMKYLIARYSGGAYMLSITDPDKAAAFAGMVSDYVDQFGQWKYDSNAYDIDNQAWRKYYGETIGKPGTFDSKKNAAYEKTLSSILSGTDTGVALSKTDGNGEFKTINILAIQTGTDPNGTPVYSFTQTDCN